MADEVVVTDAERRLLVFQAWDEKRDFDKETYDWWMTLSWADRKEIRMDWEFEQEDGTILDRGNYGL